MSEEYTDTLPGPKDEEEMPPPIDEEIEGIFDSVGLGADDNMDEDEETSSHSGSDDEELSDSEETMDNACSGILDLLFTGEVSFRS